MSLGGAPRYQYLVREQGKADGELLLPLLPYGSGY